jgi:hypothetical protein
MKLFNENLSSSENARPPRKPSTIDVRDGLSHKTRKRMITDETGSIASVCRTLLWILWGLANGSNAGAACWITLYGGAPCKTLGKMKV